MPSHRQHQFSQLTLHSFADMIQTSGFATCHFLHCLIQKVQSLIPLSLLVLSGVNRVCRRLFSFCSSLKTVRLMSWLAIKVPLCMYCVDGKVWQTCFRACFCSLLSSGMAAVIKRLAACILTSVARFDVMSIASELTLLTFRLKRLMRSYAATHSMLRKDCMCSCITSMNLQAEGVAD